jgi:hypothetical protein
MITKNTPLHGGGQRSWEWFRILCVDKIGSFPFPSKKKFFLNELEEIDYFRLFLIANCLPFFP